MATSQKAQQNQHNMEPAADRNSPSEGKEKTFKLLGWRYFGLFKPRFKLDLQHKNSAYEKGYN